MRRCLAFAMLCGTIPCLIAVASARGDERSQADMPSAVAGGAASAASETSSPRRIRFQRIHVPADRVKDWPLGEGRYLPMSRDQFERLVDSRDVAANHAAPRVAEVEFRGSLTDEGHLKGTARLRVESPGRSAGFLALPVGRFAVNEVRWSEPGRTTTFGGGELGASGILVEASGWLEWGWTLKSRSVVSGDGLFEFDLPTSAKISLVLDLPADVTAECKEGILVETEANSNGRKTWRFALGGRRKAAVQLARADAKIPSDSRPEVHESVVYHFSRRGVEVEAKLRFEAVTRPPRRLSFLLDPGLTLVAARHGQTPVTWASSPDGEDGSTRVVVELVESSSSQILHLTTWCPLVADRPWLLPRIRPTDAFWREGDAMLLVSDELRLARAREIDCRQSRLGRFPGTDDGETLEFQYFSPDATVEVVLSESLAPVRVDHATHVELTESETAGTVVAVFKSTEGKVFDLEAKIEPTWVVDSVISIPSGRVKDWRLERGQEATDRLVMRLDGPLSPNGDSVRIEIVGRRLESPLGRVLRMSDLTPVHFPTAVSGKRLVALRTGAPHGLATSGDESLRRISFEDPDAETRALLPDAWDGPIFEHDSNADSFRVELTRQRPGYAAEIEVEATATGESLLESYRFRCVPKLSRMEHIVVRFSHARETAPRWSLGEEEGHPLSARRLTDSEQSAAGMVPGPETWKISLVPSRGDPFDIRAARTVPFREETSVSLASLPEADSQSAVLTIRTVEELPPRIANRRLEPIPTAPAPPGEYQTVRGTFRYDPVRIAQSAQDESIAIAPADRTDSHGSLIAWSRRIDSRFEESGGSRHVATYYVENLGRPTIEIVFPASKRESQIREVWIDGRAASWRPEALKSGDKLLSIDLPPGKRFLIIQIDFSTDCPGLGFLGFVSPPELSIDAPVPISHWIVWLPPSHRLLESAAISRASWRQRLFGPLGRPFHATPFDPRAVEDWKQLADWAVSESPERGREGLLKAIGGPTDAPRPTTATTVGELLTRRSVRDVGFSLLVDEPALSSAGVFPSTPLEENDQAARTGHGTTWLRKAGLAVLALDDVALLTSSLRASLLQDDLEPTESSLAWRVLPGSLESSLRAAAKGQGNEPWMDVATWQRHPPRDASPWHHLDQQLPAIARDTRGWNAYCLELDASGPVRRRVVHGSAPQIVRWTVFLAAVGLGIWQGVPRPRLLAWAAVVCAVLVFLLPVILAIAASGALLGTLVCLAVVLLRAWGRADTVSEPTTRGGGSARARVARDLMPTLLVSIVASSGLGWSVPSVAGERESPVGVLIPVDERRLPKGEKVYVPESLYRQLTQRNAADGAGEWLIETAVYRGALRWEESSRRLVPGEMRSEFRVHVFSPSRGIRIPFSREELTLLSDWAFLDGEVVRPEWEAGGKAFRVAVPSEGYYRLEVVFTPAAAASPSASPREAASRDGGEFAVRIPPVPQSRLELTLPDHAPAIEAPSARGEVTIREQQLSAMLGATDELRVRWRGDAPRPDGEPPAEVDELLLMSITPGSIMLEARFRVRVLHGRVGEIMLSVDPRMEPVGRPSIGRLETVAGSPGQLRAVLPSPRSEDFTYRVRFSLREASGVGHHRLPRVGVDGPRVAGRWFAVSVDDSLEWSETAGVAASAANPVDEAAKSQDEHHIAGDGRAGLEQIAIPDFVALWGDADVAPRLAYRCLGESAEFSIATRPRRPRTVVDQRLTASVGPTQAALRYEASLGRTPGHGFRYRLLVSPSVTIDSLTVRESNVDGHARWSRSEDGSVEVFLPGPAAARRHLVFEGRMDVPREGVFELPIPTVAEAYQQSCHVTLFRQTPVLLELDRYEGLGEAEAEVVAADQAGLGYLVVSMINSGNKPPRLWLGVAPNRPDTTVRQTTHMEYIEEKWSARTQFEIEARGGSADELRVVLPANLQGPFVLTPALRSTSTTLADGRKELTVQFGPSLLDQREFSLTVSLSDDSPAAPDIAVRGARSIERRVILPRRAGDRPLRWDVQRLERISSTHEAITYRAADDGFRAVLLPSGGEGPGRGARVRLTDIQLAWNDDGILHGVSSFDVEPSGRSWLPLVLPEGYELVQTLVDGMMAAPEPEQNGPVEDERGRFRIRLGPPSLPCRITVVFRGRIRDRLAGSSFTFPAPRLGDLPVEKSIWVVAGPGSREHHGRPSASKGQLDAARADALTRLIQSAAQGKAVPSDKRSWSDSWRGRFLGIESAMEQYIALSPTVEARKPLEQTLESLRRQWASLEEAGGERTSFQVGTVAPRDEEAMGLFRQDFLGCHETAVYRAAMAGHEPLTVRYRPRSPSWTSRDLPGLLLLVLFVATGHLAVRRGAFRAVMGCWPEALLIVVGLAWWLWLLPSVLGLLVVLVGFWQTVRRLWSKRRRPGSVVISVE